VPCSCAGWFRWVICPGSERFKLHHSSSSLDDAHQS
jgi:hypothetical protein